MKKKLRIRYDAGRTVEREVNYIPVRYLLALALAVPTLPTNTSIKKQFTATGRMRPCVRRWRMPRCGVSG